MKERLKHALEDALRHCYQQGVLHSGEIPELVLEVPAHADHGDFASNVAMLLARAEKKAPRQIAEAIIAALGEGDGLWRRLEMAGPGFINFFLTNRCWYGVLDEV
ncbi:MAG TPA: arginine--tRNA ligase, partial [Desulfuromonadales bacterium]|nr:arginine--tRNA ligase [Desulfuromonadales bacterium]